MSLLDNIIAGIAKTRPALSELEKEKRKRENDEREKQRLAREQFKAKCEVALEKFKHQKEHPSLRYPPMAHFLRLVIHEVAEAKGLVSHSFGVEEERFVMVYKEDTVPNDEEVAKIKAKFKGEDPEQAVKLSAEELNRRLEEEFRRKEEQLIESEKAAGIVSKTAVKRTLAAMQNDSDLVPLNVVKKDWESVEDVRKEIIKKRRKVGDEETSVHSSAVVPSHSPAGDTEQS